MYLVGLRSIPEQYRVMFLQGGGVGMFSAIPLNFIGRGNELSADYIIAGSWSDAAAREAEKYAKHVHRITPPSGNAHHCMYSARTLLLNHSRKRGDLRNSTLSFVWNATSFTGLSHYVRPGGYCFVTRHASGSVCEFVRLSLKVAQFTSSKD